MKLSTITSLLTSLLIGLNNNDFYKITKQKELNIMYKKGNIV